MSTKDQDYWEIVQKNNTKRIIIQKNIKKFFLVTELILDFSSSSEVLSQTASRIIKFQVNPNTTHKHDVRQTRWIST